MNGDIMFKSAVNGFNREDVLNYIGQLKAEFHTYKTEAEKKSAQLEKRMPEILEYASSIKVNKKAE